MTAGDIQIRAGSHINPMSGVVCNGADDYIAIAGLAAAEAGGAFKKGTISLWCNVPNQTGTFSLFSLGDTNANEILGLRVVAGKLQGINVDGGTPQWTTTSTNVVIPAHTWTHCCLVHNGIRPTLYVNGVAVAMTDSVTTDLTEWTDGLEGLDTACIGLDYYNNVLVNDLLGAVTYFKYSHGTLTSADADWTPAQVLAEYQYKAGMPGTIGSGTTPNLIFLSCQGTLVDTITGGGTYDGTLTSDAQYDSEYSNWTSVLRTLAPLVADDLCVVSTGGGGMIATLVNAA